MKIAHSRMARIAGPNLFCRTAKKQAFGVTPHHHGLICNRNRQFDRLQVNTQRLIYEI